MKRKFTPAILLLTLTIVMHGQTASLNQFDSKGKKDGKWVIYLDKDWKKIEDSTKALFFRYTVFDHGINIYPMGPCGGKNYRLEKSLETKLLNGEYKWYDSKGRLSSIHTFKDGEYISCKEFFSTGELSQHFDYTKKCEGQAHGWRVYCYDKKGNLTLTSETCKDTDGNWPKMRG